MPILFDFYVLGCYNEIVLRKMSQKPYQMEGVYEFYESYTKLHTSLVW